jgi:hypothetical protein
MQVPSTPVLSVSLTFLLPYSRQNVNLQSPSATISVKSTGRPSVIASCQCSPHPLTPPLNSLHSPAPFRISPSLQGSYPVGVGFHGAGADAKANEAEALVRGERPASVLVHQLEEQLHLRDGFLPPSCLIPQPRDLVFICGFLRVHHLYPEQMYLVSSKKPE